MIGAGQAGLAMGHFLARQGRPFVIVEAGDSVGSAWRARWDSLTLFTPRRYDRLPGLAFPGDPDGYPTRDEVVAYLERYAATFGRPIELGSAVRSLTQRDGAFVADLGSRRLEADTVIWATGYRLDHSWIELPVRDPEGRVQHRRGATGVAGLYLLGLSWQHTRGSALLGWVEDDAEFIATRIDALARIGEVGDPSP